MNYRRQGKVHISNYWEKGRLERVQINEEEVEELWGRFKKAVLECTAKVWVQEERGAISGITR